MAEVTLYSHDHRRGGLSHRLPTASPAPRAPFLSPHVFRDIGLDLLHMNYNSSSSSSISNAGPPIYLLGGRSASVSSSSSSPSLRAIKRPTSRASRTLSPAAAATESAAGVSPGIGRPQNSISSYVSHQSPQPSYQASFVTHTPLPSSLVLSPPHYLQQPQVNSQMPMYQRQISAPGAYAQPSAFAYHMSPLPSQPSPLSFHVFPPIYSSFSASSYQEPLSPPATAAASMSQYSTSLTSYQPQQRGRHGPSGFQKLPAEVLNLLKFHLGYLGVIALSRANKWCYSIFDPNECSHDEKIAGVRDAEKFYRRYFPNRKPTPPVSSIGNGRQQGRGMAPRNPGFFACYYCYRIKGPDQFELFTWNNSPAKDVNCKTELDPDLDDAYDHGPDQESISTSSRGPFAGIYLPPSAPLSGPSSQNQFYDPTLTRTELDAKIKMEKEKAKRRASSSSAAAAAASTFKQHSGSNNSYQDHNVSPRIKSTWGQRRCCVPCGLQHDVYGPGDLIELFTGKNDAVWICYCRKTHRRPIELSCQDCQAFIPLSTPGRRRG
ncbi:hypothetical protein B0T17DRAFT_206824 [Bombardia bombarda]|uniref:Uncharacterized protein n=1 Tax=Bombardia bombarda TaxID=252184 RepID=A0AA39XAR5_9PEZI|nr:hypothetical protein B0T17DRAFT_206824 [Bombardia bombarda]